MASRQWWHARAFDTFPRAVEMLRELGYDPVRIASKLAREPAEWFALRHRGVLAPRSYADLVVLQDAPGSQGMPIVNHVVINGQVSVESQLPLVEVAGRAIR